MRKKGSITVFLALVFGVLFSLVLCALEAARLQGATAYVSMLSELAGDSLLARYYYPLFQEYRLFGVHAGDEAGYFSEEKIVTVLTENMEYGTEELKGGLLAFEKTDVELVEYETILSGSGSGVLSQMKEQILLDGLSLTISRFFSEEMFQEAAVAGEVYKKQEETMASISPVTEEVLKLMELADGICTGKNGLEFEEDGRLKVADTFIKQLVPVEPEQFKCAYENAEVGAAVAGNLYSVEDVAAEILHQAEAGIRLERKISSLASELDGYRRNLDALSSELSLVQERILEYQSENMEQEKVQIETQTEERSASQTKEQYVRDLQRQQELQSEIEGVRAQLWTVSSERDSAVWQLDQTMQSAKRQYENLRQKLAAVENVHQEMLKVLDTLEEKQLLARVSVTAYETFLNGIEVSLSEELYQVFEQELVTMKAYLGMEEQGYVVEKMRQSVAANQLLLQQMELEGFSEWNLSQVKREMQMLQSKIAGYTVENLWFTYGTIVVAENTGQNVLGTLKEFLAEGVLALAGITEAELSDRELTGQELPSASLKKEAVFGELLACMDSMIQLFRSGELGTSLSGSLNKAWDAAALELYCMKYFHCYGESAPYTKLNYEREYLLCGEQEDATNLFYTVLQLVAVRTLFRMVAVLKSPERMAELETFSAGIAGLTGIPVLLAVVKYALLLLWSVEEAFVEVAALLQGKRVAVLDPGSYISFSEIFRFGRTLIAAKARGITDSAVGVKYQEYLVLLSLTVPVKVKLYRALDLMQENIRYRYEDTFRIRNVVTEVDFLVTGRLKEKFNMGLFPESVYELEWKEQSSY